jgi:hypothetical protein
MDVFGSSASSSLSIVVEIDLNIDVSDILNRTLSLFESTGWTSRIFEYYLR